MSGAGNSRHAVSQTSDWPAATVQCRGTSTGWGATVPSPAGHAVSLCCLTQTAGAEEAEWAVGEHHRGGATTCMTVKRLAYHAVHPACLQVLDVLPHVPQQQASSLHGRLCACPSHHSD